MITFFKQRDLFAHSLGRQFFMSWALAQRTLFHCKSAICFRSSEISRCIRDVAAPTKKKHIGRNAKKAGRHHPGSDPLDADRARRERKAQKAAGVQ